MQAQVLTPTYDVEIKRPFAMPDFVAMDLGPDRIGMTQLFAGEIQVRLRRLQAAQAQKLMAPASLAKVTLMFRSARMRQTPALLTKCWTTSARSTPARCP